jgi:hypothetical protein
MKTPTPNKNPTIRGTNQSPIYRFIQRLGYWKLDATPPMIRIYYTPRSVFSRLSNSLIWLRSHRDIASFMRGVCIKWTGGSPGSKVFTGVIV